MRTEAKGHRLALYIAAALIVATLGVYIQVKDHAFVDFDDEEYITANPHVRSGLTLDNVIWAFRSAHSNNWHPLTWISHMTDVELFGLRPGGHHLMNVLFHTINAVLLFFLLRRMTGAIWRSAAVAALFALHPLHVESVAWAAERKDVLSALFWLLTLWAYVRYTERPGWKRYGMVVACFSLGLMAKQMLVTLPFVLLLLDYWPLRRFSLQSTTPEDPSPAASPGKRQRGKASAALDPEVPEHTADKARWQRLAGEKIPLLLLAAAAGITVYMVQLKSGVLFGLASFPLEARLANAIMSYAAYLGKTIWPVHLAVFYPHPHGAIHTGEVLAAATLLIVITLICLKYRDRPYLPVGWFWYLGTLVPVIGLVQVGVQAMADRYTYLPLIGLFMMIAWGIPDLIGKWSYRRPALIAFSAMALISCCLLAWVQVGTWKDRETLYAHAAAVIPDNYWAFNNLAVAVAARGNMDEAMMHLAKSLAITPLYPGANKNMAVALYKKGRFAEAIPYIRKALRIQPRNQEYQVILGMTLLQMGNGREAVAQLREAVSINPAEKNAREALAEALMKFPEAGR